MTRESQRPTETRGTGLHKGDIERRHPAFGMIGAFRQQGGNCQLFGSPIRHNSTVRIDILAAHEILSLHQEWRHADQIIASVVLSEAQWASFVSAMNVGFGVPCTLELYRSGDTLVQPPDIEDESFVAKLADDIKGSAEKTLAEVRALAARFHELLGAGRPPVSALKEMDQALQRIVEQLPGNMKFMAESMTEHVEDLVAVAKAEVSAVVTRLAMQYPALARGAPDMPAIEHQPDTADGSPLPHPTRHRVEDG